MRRQEILEKDLAATVGESESFADILAPVYAHTRESGATDEEIGDFVDAEIAAYRAERRALKGAAPA